MSTKECVAMILAGGQGVRLGVLTKKDAKPAVPFGGKYKIIDFTLSNCSHSGIDTVGVLTQYQPLELNTYIGNGQSWNLDSNDGGVFILPPHIKEEKGEWYKGTANAIFQNISFIEKFSPEHVLVLSGDHIYKMDYSKMLEFHKEKNAAITIAVLGVPWEDASRFGIMNINEQSEIIEFEEKPANPKSNLASMGVYVFKWDILKRYLMVDENNPKSSNDFGKNIIPAMLAGGDKMVAYKFEGYWKDVGTIQSLWEANMDLLKDAANFTLHDENWRIYSRNPVMPPHYIASGASVKNSFITAGCDVYGKIENSILFEGVKVDEGVEIYDSIIMPNVRLGRNVKIYKSIVASDTEIKEGAQIGVQGVNDTVHASKMCGNGITVIASNIMIEKNVKIGSGCMVEKDVNVAPEIHLATEANEAVFAS